MTLQDYTDKVVDVLDAASQPVILVGHSMGGAVISQAAEARPNKVAKLVYVADVLATTGTSILDILAQDTASLATQALFTVDLDGDGLPDVLDLDRNAIEAAVFNTSSDEDVALANALLTPTGFLPGRVENWRGDFRRGD